MIALNSHCAYCTQGGFIIRNEQKPSLMPYFPQNAVFWNVQQLTSTVEEKAQRRRQLLSNCQRWMIVDKTSTGYKRCMVAATLLKRLCFECFLAHPRTKTASMLWVQKKSQVSSLKITFLRPWWYSFYEEGQGVFF